MRSRTKNSATYKHNNGIGYTPCTTTERTRELGNEEIEER